MSRILPLRGGILIFLFILSSKYIRIILISRLPYSINCDRFSFALEIQWHRPDSCFKMNSIFRQQNVTTASL